MPLKITGILLAAGSCTRFGSDKLLHTLSTGKTIIETAAENLSKVIDDVLVVVDPKNTMLIQHIEHLGLCWVENINAQRGMGRSIASGVKAKKKADAWIIALADMPCVLPETIRKIAEAIASEGKIICPYFKEKRGHPVGFSNQYFNALKKLDGDRGAKQIIETNPDSIIKVVTNDPGILIDIDRKEHINIDLDGLLNRFK